MSAMIGSSSMQKDGRFQWLLFVLAGLLLILGFLTSGSVEMLARATPGAQAAGTNIRSSGGVCTRSGQGPSFGGTIVIGQAEVLCGNITSFGGTVEIKGEIRGKVTVFNGDVINDGDVNGDITLFGGAVTLGNGSQVHGNIELYGAKERRGQGTQLDGSITDHTGHAWMYGKVGEFSFQFCALLAGIVLSMVFITLQHEHLIFVRTTAMTKKRTR